jgi:hypothetical protein
MKRLKMLGVGSIFGYTIVEVMIFLAISGALFVSASALISGRQERTMFQQSVNTTSQTLEDILNDVSTGYYPSRSDFSCTYSGGALSLSAISSQQGTNQSCIFSGKLLSFTTLPASSSYSVYTMISNNPDLSTPGSNPDITNVNTLLLGGPNPGIVDQKTINVDVAVTKIFEDSPPYISYNNLAVVSDFGSLSTTGTLSANASKAKLYWYKSTPPTATTNTKLIATDFVQVQTDHNVIICLEQGTGADANHSAYIALTPQLTISKVVGTKRANC